MNEPNSDNQEGAAMPVNPAPAVPTAQQPVAQSPAPAVDPDEPVFPSNMLLTESCNAKDAKRNSESVE